LKGKTLQPYIFLVEGGWQLQLLRRLMSVALKEVIWNLSITLYNEIFINPGVRITTRQLAKSE
jgi:hypothetical protein